MLSAQTLSLNNCVCVVVMVCVVVWVCVVMVLQLVTSDNNETEFNDLVSEGLKRKN